MRCRNLGLHFLFCFTPPLPLASLILHMHFVRVSILCIVSLPGLFLFICKGEKTKIIVPLVVLRINSLFLISSSFGILRLQIILAVSRRPCPCRLLDSVLATKSQSHDQGKLHASPCEHGRRPESCLAPCSRFDAAVMRKRGGSTGSCRVRPILMRLTDIRFVRRERFQPGYGCI